MSPTCRPWLLLLVCACACALVHADDPAAPTLVPSYLLGPRPPASTVLDGAPASSPRSPPPPAEPLSREALSRLEEQFNAWAVQYRRKYTPEQRAHRFNIYQINARRVAAHNAEEAEGRHTYSVGLNRFADYDFDAGETYVSGKYIPPIDESIPQRRSTCTPSTAGTVNWLVPGKVTPVIDGGPMCASSWAVSAAGALEGQWSWPGQAPALSTQELLDCSHTPTGNQGCPGGTMDLAFEYVIAKGGKVETAANYPYIGMDAPCAATGPSWYSSPSRLPVPAVTQIIHPTPLNEWALLAAVGDQPVSVAIDSSSWQFQLYIDGIFNDMVCGLQPDLGALVTGYGVDPLRWTASHGQNYWIVKNSWGDAWGDCGYIHLTMNDGPYTSNICGILYYPSYPSP